MIVTLTLNAALDKSTEIDRLIAEKKMRCKEMLIEAGGGGINVSKAIHELEGESTAVYFSGGLNGEILTGLLENKKIVLKPVKIKGDTRESFVASELSTNKQYRFVMPGPAIDDDEIKRLKNVIAEIPAISYLVCSGSLPAGVSPSVLGDIALFAKQNNIRLVLDTSGEPLKAAISKGVYLLKPNLTELCSLVGKNYLEPSEIEQAAKQILESGGCEVLVVSMGPSGALLVTKNNTKQITAPIVKKQSTVGAGDSMVAGIVWMLEQKSDIADAVRFGVACGTAATINKGSQLFKKADALQFYDWIKNRP